MPLAPRTGQQVGGLEQDRAPARRRTAPASPGRRPARRRSRRGRRPAWSSCRTPSTCWWSWGCTTGDLGAAAHLLLRRRWWRVRSSCRSSWALQLQLQRGPLGAAGCVGEVRLVDGSRRVGDGVHGPIVSDARVKPKSPQTTPVPASRSPISWAAHQPSSWSRHRSASTSASSLRAASASRAATTSGSASAASASTAPT